MKIKEILVGPLLGKMNTIATTITTNHIPGNTINKVFVCETDRTRYFRTYAMSDSEDVFYEFGYSSNLLINESLETMQELLTDKELVEATEEQEEQVKDENRWL